VSLKEREVATLRASLKRAREEDIHFKSETRAHEIHYDTAAPVDTVTGKQRVLREFITSTRGWYEKTVAEDEIRHEEASSARESLAVENRSRIQAVDKLTRADMALQEKSSSSRFNYKLFLAGVATGLVIALLLRRVL